MTLSQLVDAFFNLHPTPTETTSEFILRVEDTRARVGVDQVTTFRSFFPRLPADVRHFLEREVDVCHILHKPQELTWEIVVGFAKRMSSRSNSSGATITGPGYVPIPRTEPAAGVATVLTAGADAAKPPPPAAPTPGGAAAPVGVPAYTAPALATPAHIPSTAPMPSTTPAPTHHHTPV